tara:strand:- start:2631 stop:2825 length:195 start_codon:yes stop_codon:yes gene_type:complete
MFIRILKCTEYVGKKKSPQYYRRKAKENYKINKELRNEYRSSTITGTFSAFKKSKTKRKSNSII